MSIPSSARRCPLRPRLALGFRRAGATCTGPGHAQARDCDAGGVSPGITPLAVGRARVDAGRPSVRMRGTEGDEGGHLPLTRPAAAEAVRDVPGGLRCAFTVDPEGRSGEMVLARWSGPRRVSP